MRSGMLALSVFDGIAIMSRTEAKIWVERRSRKEKELSRKNNKLDIVMRQCLYVGIITFIEKQRYYSI